MKTAKRNAVDRLVRRYKNALKLVGYLSVSSCFASNYCKTIICCVLFSRFWLDL